MGLKSRHSLAGCLYLKVSLKAAVKEPAEKRIHFQAFAYPATACNSSWTLTLKTSVLCLLSVWSFPRFSAMWAFP